jgi:CHASE2 domain-containing sensor protein
VIVATQLAAAMDERPAAERWGAIVAVIGGFSALLIATSWAARKRGVVRYTSRYTGAR